jgi:hypothetical protein
MGWREEKYVPLSILDLVFIYFKIWNFRQVEIEITGMCRLVVECHYIVDGNKCHNIVDKVL